jgi:hypothetical protein
VGCVKHSSQSDFIHHACGMSIKSSLSMFEGFLGAEEAKGEEACQS